MRKKRLAGQSVPEDFDKNVFINCPLDKKFTPLFRAMIFAVHDVGFRPRCALESSNAGQVRLIKILDIIAECKYSIHDLSRTELDDTHGLPRFNMPLELGLDLGCKRYGQEHQQEKVLLIFDKEQYRYQKFISDIAGQDIAEHQSKESHVINTIRKFFMNERRVIIPSGEEITRRYRTFKRSLPTICAELKLNANDLSFIELSYVAATWTKNHPL